MACVSLSPKLSRVCCLSCRDLYCIWVERIIWVNNESVLSRVNSHIYTDPVLPKSHHNFLHVLVLHSLSRWQVNLNYFDDARSLTAFSVFCFVNDGLSPDVRPRRFTLIQQLVSSKGVMYCLPVSVSLSVCPQKNRKSCRLIYRQFACNRC